MKPVILDCGVFEVLKTFKQTQDKSVSLARSLDTDEQVILRTQTQESPAYHLLSLIQDSHLVKVIGVQRLGEKTYIVEEYVHGKTLSEVVKNGALSEKRVIRIALQLCGALETLHQAGIVHRDIKPENVFLLEDDTVKLFDFDAARIYKFSANGDTSPLGTAGFAAPEQFGLMQSDARSDIYSFGILLNILLTGVHPTIRLCRGFLRRIVLRCIHVSPQKRYQSIQSVKKRLEAAGKRMHRIAIPFLLVLLAGLLVCRFCFRNPEYGQQKLISGEDAETLKASTTISQTPGPSAQTELKTSAKKKLLMPMGYSEWIESVQEYTLNGEIYYLILSMDEKEMDDPQLNANTRHFYLPEHEMVPVHLYVVPADGDPQKIQAFKEQVEEIHYEILSENDEKKPFALRNFSVFRYSDANLLAWGEVIAGVSGNEEPQHRMISCRIRMKNDDRLSLNHSITQVPANIELSCEQYPMETAEQLNKLLRDLELAYGWNPHTPVTLLLPETTYTEEIVIQGRAVILQGARNGTVFTKGLRITAADDAEIILRDLSFSGRGFGDAIASARDVIVIDCSFEGYDTAWRAVNGAQFRHYNSVFNVTIPPEEEQ